MLSKRASNDGERMSEFQAWHTLLRNNRWSASYERRMRILLAHGLSILAPALAQVILPTHPPSTEMVFATRSQERRFELATCLPLAIRTPVHSPGLQRNFLLVVAREWMDHLRSISRQHLQKIIRFVHHLVFDMPPLLTDNEIEVQRAYLGYPFNNTLNKGYFTIGFTSKNSNLSPRILYHGILRPIGSTDWRLCTQRRNAR